MPLEKIESLAKQHAADRAQLGDRMRSLQEEIDSCKRRRLPGIKAALSAAKDSRLRLHALISEAPGEFVKPRTRILHGIKLGFAKGRGVLRFSHRADLVIRLIRKHFPDKADVLIRTTEAPVKKALQQLPAVDLKKIGGAIQGTGDVVVIEPADSELDKLVDALLGEPNEQLGDDEEEAA